MSKRIVGIDVARAIAIIGMIIVNFKVVFGAEGDPFLQALVSAMTGKAAATFVVLAGVGIALMTNSAVRSGDPSKLRTVRWRLLRRAAFLFVVGLAYIPIWRADILHFYGIYMLLTAILLRSSARQVLLIASLLVLSYPILFILIDYQLGWNFATLEYAEFWSVSGFLRNLFYNGFHPVIPWASFMLFGLWYGRQDLRDDTYVRRSLMIGLAVALAVQIVSTLSLTMIGEGVTDMAQLAAVMVATDPMPPMPLYMIQGSALSIVVIASCILLARKYAGSSVITILSKTGQLALTFYVAHVIIGMGLVEHLGDRVLGTYTIEMSLLYALLFSLVCILFAHYWQRRFKVGPLEWLMRKIADGY